MDALAAGGCALEKTSCKSPICLPSRTSMTLGRYAMNRGIFSKRNAPDQEAPTFLHALRSAGIHTLVELIEIGQTVCDLIRVSSHETDQGRSLVPLLKGATEKHRNTV
jgi:hypothetical protein